MYRLVCTAQGPFAREKTEQQDPRSRTHGTPAPRGTLGKKKKRSTLYRPFVGPVGFLEVLLLEGHPGAEGEERTGPREGQVAQPPP